MDLFAGICVRDYEAAKTWYERFFGREPTFIAHETECVWDLADHRSIFILEDSERAGHATHTIFVDDLETIVDEIESRGIKAAKRETYKNGVRKATFRDPDGNEIGFGGAPLEEADS
jgi:predicted enzyme related to lactoylglutathione lyase